jgi:probable F420-dependent oxidoreductase
MKVRIGFGITGARPVSAEAFATIVDGLESLGWDSLWLSERMSTPSPDPVTALAFAAGRTRRIKLGTSVSVLPGRNPAEVATTWATLDRLSGGRALPAFGLGVVHPNEQQAFGVERTERVARFEEMLPLVRRLWVEDRVDHDGRFFHYEGLQVQPKATKPLDVWMGGRAPAELRRIGRLADGWLASFAMPQTCAQGRIVIDAAAADAGRAIDPEHFGAMVFYRHGPLPEALATMIASRPQDPEHAVDPDVLVPDGFAAVRARCEEFVAAGFSKLVLVPFTEPDDWTTELAAGAEAIADLQT